MGPTPWSLSKGSEAQAREAQALSPRLDEHHPHGQWAARRFAPADDLAPLGTRKTKNPAGPFTAQRGSFTSSINTKAGDLAVRFARSVSQPEKLIQLDENRTFVCPNYLLLYLILGGGGGIRTHGRLPFTRFPSVPIRPLSHSSVSEQIPRGQLQTSRLPDAVRVNSGSL